MPKSVLTIKPRSLPEQERRRITVLGATGSIGKNTLALLTKNPRKFDVVCLTAHQNADALADAALATQVQMVVISDESYYKRLKERLSGTGIKCLAGAQGLLEAASISVDVVISAIVGISALLPTMKALEHAKCVGIANKECLVAAGPLILDSAHKFGTTIIPIDSEHNSLFQLLQGRELLALSKLTITASGGPFRGFSREQLQEVTVDQALNHPTWLMGVKNTLDSATLVNKGLELIEACYLFGVDEKDVDVVIHPQSLVHSMISFSDNSHLMHLSRPDMRVSIGYALNWPSRLPFLLPALDLRQIGTLVFEGVDHHAFPALTVARKAFRKGNAGTLAYNAANEVAVNAFMQGRISFSRIVDIVEEILEQQALVPLLSLEDICQLDKEVRQKAEVLSGRAQGEVVRR